MSAPLVGLPQRRFAMMWPNLSGGWKIRSRSMSDCRNSSRVLSRICAVAVRPFSSFLPRIPRLRRARKPLCRPCRSGPDFSSGSMPGWWRWCRNHAHVHTARCAAGAAGNIPCTVALAPAHSPDHRRGSARSHGRSRRLRCPVRDSRHNGCILLSAFDIPLADRCWDCSSIW